MTYFINHVEPLGLIYGLTKCSTKFRTPLIRNIRKNKQKELLKIALILKVQPFPFISHWASIPWL